MWIRDRIHAVCRAVDIELFILIHFFSGSQNRADHSVGNRVQTVHFGIQLLERHIFAIFDDDLFLIQPGLNIIKIQHRVNIAPVSYTHLDVYKRQIYNPAETKLLQMAKSVGCQTINGLPMLLYQGAEAFHLWTGQEMPVAAVKEKYFS